MKRTSKQALFVAALIAMLVVSTVVRADSIDISVPGRDFHPQSSSALSRRTRYRLFWTVVLFRIPALGVMPHLFGHACGLAKA